VDKVSLIGRGVMLRDAVQEDMPAYVRWFDGGEWLELDAPWEKSRSPTNCKEIEKRFCRLFLEDLNRPRRRLIISLSEGGPIGWVNRYDEPRFADSWNIGACICVDDCLNRGFGTEALQLWVNYLFSNSDIHRLAFATYSFNPRVVRVAEKLGFLKQGRDREIVRWQGEWVDRLHFSLLRQEWRSGHEQTARD
jgi:RimJ/RimL family protein N-acetyltransferase